MIDMNESDLDDILDIKMDDFEDIDALENLEKEATMSNSEPEKKENSLSLNDISPESLLDLDFDDEDEDDDSFKELKELEDTLSKDNPLEEAKSTDEDDEDAEDWDFSIIKSKLQKILIPAAVVVVVVIILATMLGKKTASTPAIDGTDVDINTLNTGLFETTGTLNVDEKRQQDYFIAYKYMFTWNDLGQPVLKGETTKTKKTIEVPVDIELFNSIQDGQIITIYYDLVTFNGNQYISNIILGEVVGE